MCIICLGPLQTWLELSIKFFKCDHYLLYWQPMLSHLGPKILHDPVCVCQCNIVRHTP